MMIEEPTQNNNVDDERRASRQEKIKLAKELFENGEVFPFPGINSESYDKIVQEQEEYPGYTTPIDELLVRFQNEGLKIMLNKSEMDILILPAGSDDIISDFLLPRNLSAEGDIDERLLSLISTK